uniref:RNA-binding protein 5-like isoform X3 n=1 Tax=Petromyzon marinus TaxID=7757 RepID=A0AAJ7U1X5_PETMA|nr:RNA-binding protein 5-like isoform X3 [Petromyzon marinus]
MNFNMGRGPYEGIGGRPGERERFSQAQGQGGQYWQPPDTYQQQQQQQQLAGSQSPADELWQSGATSGTLQSNFWPGDGTRNWDGEFPRVPPPGGYGAPANPSQVADFRAPIAGHRSMDPLGQRGPRDNVRGYWDDYRPPGEFHEARESGAGLLCDAREGYRADVGAAAAGVEAGRIPFGQSEYGDQRAMAGFTPSGYRISLPPPPENVTGALFTLEQRGAVPAEGIGSFVPPVPLNETAFKAKEEPGKDRDTRLEGGFRSGGGGGGGGSGYGESLSRRRDYYSSDRRDRPERRDRQDRDSRSDSRRDSRSDSRGDIRGDSRGDNRGDSRGNIRGDNRSDNRGDNRSDNRGDNRGDIRGDSRGNFRGDSRGDNRSDSRGDCRSDGPGDNRGDGRGDVRGDIRGDIRGDNHGDIRGDSRGESRGDNRGESRGDNRGESRGDNRGESRGDSRGDCRSDSRGDHDFRDVDYRARLSPGSNRADASGKQSARLEDDALAASQHRRDKTNRWERVSLDDVPSGRYRAQDRDPGEPELENDPVGVSGPAVILRDIPHDVEQEEIRAFLKTFNGPVRSVRIFKKFRGWSRSFAIVDFIHLHDASRWMEAYQFHLLLRGQRVALEPCQSNLWRCPTCQGKNFWQHSWCLRCQHSREEKSHPPQPANEPDLENANKTLILHNLSATATLEEIVEALAPLVILSGDNLRLIKQKGTRLNRGFAFLEMPSTLEAIQLFQTIEGQECPILVHGKRIHADFAKATSSQEPFDFNRATAATKGSAAIAAARWSSSQPSQGSEEWNAWSSYYQQNGQQGGGEVYMQDYSQYYQQAEALNSAIGAAAAAAPSAAAATTTAAVAAAAIAAAGLATTKKAEVEVPAAQPALVEASQQKDAEAMPTEPQSADASVTQDGDDAFSMPDASSFLYDKTSGYYYDPQSGLYYDPKSQYFYNAEKQQYMYWDPETKQYLPAPTADDSNPPGGSQEADGGDGGGDGGGGGGGGAGGGEESTAVSQSSDESKMMPPPPPPAPTPSTGRDAGGERERKMMKPKTRLAQQVSRKIAKDMERWAKTLNRNKQQPPRDLPLPCHPPPPAGPGHSSPPSQPLGGRGVGGGGGGGDVARKREAAAADAGFSLLEKLNMQKPRTPLGQERAERSLELKRSDSRRPEKRKASPPAPVGLVSYGGDSDSEEEPTPATVTAVVAAQTTRRDEKLTDWQKLACLLCRRQFPTKEALIRHQQLSDLHKQNLEIHRRAKLSTKELEELERREREITVEMLKQRGGTMSREMEDKESKYRDRAAERRVKFKAPTPPEPKRKYLQAPTIDYEQPTKHGIGSSNIGSKMLQAMGWREGMGLGQKRQGRTTPVEVTQRPQGSGLGVRGSNYGMSSESYKAHVLKTTAARFKELD